MSETLTNTAAGYRGDPSVACLPLMLVTPALFAVNMITARWAESAAIPPLFLAFGRWALAFVIMLPIAAPRLWAWRHTLATHRWRLLLLAGLGMGVAVGPQYIGARDTSAANIALLFAACPMLVGLIERIVWKAPLGRQRACGMFLCFAGVLIVVTKGEIFTATAFTLGRGDLWVVVAACGWALYTVLGKRRPLPPLPSTVRMTALIGGGALVLAPFALIEALAGATPDFSDSRLYGALALLATVPSLGAYFCYDRLVRQVGATGACVSMYMVPLYAALAAWPVLGETPELHHAAGFALILGGVLLSGTHDKRS